MLELLTEKERAVLDRVINRHTTKEIARDLSIAPNTVDMRVKSARAKLGARDRNDIARIYQGLLVDCGETTCGAAVMGERLAGRQELAPEPPFGATFLLEDAAAFTPQAPWEFGNAGGSLSEVLDGRFGRIWRVIAIPAAALAIALLALALMAIAQELGALI